MLGVARVAQNSGKNLSSSWLLLGHKSDFSIDVFSLVSLLKVFPCNIDPMYKPVGQIFSVIVTVKAKSALRSKP